MPGKQSKYRSGLGSHQHQARLGDLHLVSMLVNSAEKITSRIFSGTGTMTQIFGRSSKALARGRLVLKHIASSAAMVCFRIERFCTQLKTHPLVETNEPHLTRTPGDRTCT